MLLKNYKLSDDVAFRFSQKSWAEYPLPADRYAHWINALEGHSVNLFMDYETFGEHQWEDTGIFEFLKHLPQEIFKNPHSSFIFPSELAATHNPVGELDIHHFMSWADIERDLSAWKGNKMQDSALAELYALEPIVKQLSDPSILEDWRKLTTSDHFYYMCTKYFNDGDVHKYFNPYDSPYESYINFMNILNDLIHRMKECIQESHNASFDKETIPFMKNTRADFPHVLHPKPKRTLNDRPGEMMATHVVEIAARMNE